MKNNILTREKFKRCMDQIKYDIESLEKFEEEIGKYFESYIFNLGWRFIETQIEILEIAMNDNYYWIDWFIYENEWGKKQFEAGFDKKVKKIKNVNDLYNLLTF